MLFSYSSSFIVQQVCCTFSSLSVAYMQWHFRNACNTHILRAVIIMNVCQFVQEITYAYSTYLLIMLMGRKSDIPASKFNSVDETEVVHLLFASFVIHGIRLITCAYPVNVFGKKAFLAEVLCRIRFRADAQRGISSVQAKQANNTDKNETKLLFYGGLILSTLCIATDVAYYVFSNAKRIGHTGIALIYTICLAFIYYHYRKERRIMFLKLQAVVSIIILNSSIHTIYLFCEAMFTGRLYFTMNRSVENFLINVSLTVLSAKSIVFCFRTITKHTPLHTQSVTIMGPLRSLTNLAYTLIAIVIVEILFTTIMYKLYSTKIDFLSGNESFLWINSIATCLLQIWLISDCSTILLLILVQAGIVQTIVAMMTRHSKTFQHSSARIIYIVIDHILQIIQWALNIYSLGLALIVLDGVETSDDEFSEGIETRTFENEVFLGQGMREHFIDELLEAPTYSELIISECNPETDRPSCSIFDRSANIDFMWGENNVFFDDETNQGDSNINNDRDTINTNATIEKTSSSNNATESDAIEGNVDSDDIDDSDDDDGDDDDDDDNDNDMNGDDNVDSQSIAVNDEDENFS
ncbi:unnamed protein product [Acanthocheilonema viteae]|uniref:Uncharacterized protein n=1 Tax=Acanthocheilonema viteae TaxID=6277 RepID=A0A498SDK7_ACAVI|nr:unnamed protein product [Acanthocheilonema viteae]